MITKSQYYLLFFFVRLMHNAMSLHVANQRNVFKLSSSFYSSSLDSQQNRHHHHHVSKLALHATKTTTNEKTIKKNVSEFLSEDSQSNSILNAIGVPEALQNLNTGQHIRAFRNNVLCKNPSKDYSLSSPETISSDFTIERLSHAPDVFILRNFLSDYECDTIIDFTSNNSTMTKAETITVDDTESRKNCNVAWLPSSSSSSASTNTPPIITTMVSNLVTSTANILLSKEVLNHPSAGVEDLQVLKYDIGGEFVLHHDGEPRILTVIYYVNGVGGTWFPLASISNSALPDHEHDNPLRNRNEMEIEHEFEEARKQENIGSPQNKAAALKLGKGFIPGKQGLLIKSRRGEEGDVDSSLNNPNISWIKKGDAIAFYNYKNDGLGKLDWKALHTGLPTSKEDGVKWIANHWFRLEHLCDM